LTSVSEFKWSHVTCRESHWYEIRSR